MALRRVRRLLLLHHHLHCRHPLLFLLLLLPNGGADGGEQMSDLFKAISTGFARFVFAWIVPSLINVGVFTIYIWPSVQNTDLFKPIQAIVATSDASAIIVFGFLVLVIAVMVAYASLPIYQVLEGLSLPTPIRTPLIRRQRKKYIRIKEIEKRFALTQVLPPGVTVDDFRRFPADIGSIRATRLGNALAAMESWGRERYYLDSQTMWYELHSVSSDRVRKDIDEGRAPVDFCVSAIAHMFILSIVCVVTAVAVPEARTRALIIAILASFSIPISYKLAVRNVIDWAQSVKAMVNVGRVDLAASLGLNMPDKIEKEREMWSAHYWAIELNQERHFESYNWFRQPTIPVPPRSEAER